MSLKLDATFAEAYIPVKFSWPLQPRHKNGDELKYEQFPSYSFLPVRLNYTILLRRYFGVSRHRFFVLRSDRRVASLLPFPRRAAPRLFVNTADFLFALVFLSFSLVMASPIPPPLFLSTPGDPPIPWADWKLIFEAYVDAIGDDARKPERRKALLLNALGHAGLKLYQTLSSANVSETPASSDVFQAAVALFDDHFKDASCDYVARLRFQERRQLPGEPVVDFIASLRSLAASCGFGALENDMIRQQLFIGVANSLLRGLLLMAPIRSPVPANMAALLLRLGAAVNMAARLHSPFGAVNMAAPPPCWARMMLAKLELKYSMRRPMLFNTDYVSDVRQHEGPLNMEIKRVENFNATVNIKNAQNAMGYLEAQKFARATTTQKAIGALDAESCKMFALLLCKKMVLAKLELKYSMRRPMLLNTDYVSDVRQYEGPLNVTIKRVDNFNATVDIKNAQNAMGYLEAQKAAPATTTEKAIGALDAESYQIRLRYTWEHTPRKYFLIAEVSQTHADLTRRLLTFLEKRFRLLYPPFGASVEIS
ncbi:hypothetical protein HPB52_003199 [Rhipicephalus sanguineus]|uniref:Uncharacterized protein n=1 Tax=Rhipicephalus sanguineus TaxID=34632 RepID=A0A9D4PL54_RHISA|nr:hypothetical protein HPB52_003199 [Rhipicephalus sanguineus]